MTSQLLSFLKLLCHNINSASFLLFNQPTTIHEQQIKQYVEAASGEQCTYTTNNVPCMRNGCRYNNEQGIVCAQMTTNGSLLLQITPLVAAFIEGRGERQLQGICAASGGASICSWSINYVGIGPTHYTGLLKTFLMQGSAQQIHQAVVIIVAAINKYSQLIYGAFKDEVVEVQQVIGGVEFEYVPPPLDAFPYAATTIHSNSQVLLHTHHHHHHHQQSPRTHIIVLNDACIVPPFLSLAPLLPPPHVADIVAGTMLPSMEVNGPMRVINAGQNVPPTKKQIQNLKNTDSNALQ